MQARMICVLALGILTSAILIPRLTHAADPAYKIFEAIDRKAENPEHSPEGKLGAMRSYIDNAIEKLNKMVGCSDNKVASKISTSVPLASLVISSCESKRNDINQALRAAITVLSDSRLTGLKDAADKVQAEIRKLEKQNADYEIQRLSAPKTLSTVEKLQRKWAQQDYVAAIQKNKEAIAADKQVLVEIAERMQSEFEKQGVRISRDQLNGLLYSVTGDDDLQVFAAIEAVKAITIMLRDKIQGQGENIELAKRYFGLHTVLLRAIIAAQENYVQRIDGEYMPRLQRIRKRTQDLNEKSKQRQADPAVSADERKVYADDDRANQATVRVADLYERHLQANRSKLQTALTPLRQQYLAAEHRYLTVRNAAELLSLMNSANSSFDRLMALSAPPLLTFQNQEMEDRFREMTSEIAKK